MSEPRVRVRGIYATAVTALLREEGLGVVDPSSPVADRFDESFPPDLATVTVSATDDRLGVEITGESNGVGHVADRLLALSDDTFSWTSAVPLGAVRTGRVTRTAESGAIVTIGETTGFLPYGRSDAYVTEGDRLAVQVIDPEPPWAPNRRPVVSTRPHVPGIYVDLVRDSDRPAIDAPDRELQGVIELVDPGLPGDWSIVVSGAASGVDFDLLRAELDRLSDRRERVENAMQTAADPDEPGGVYAPETTVWCRIGRSGRFALDEQRATASTTIDGHHRLKAGGGDAGRAVDYLEHLGVDAPFDPAAAIESFGPSTGGRVRIEHGKPSGETIVLGRGEVVERPKPGAITVRRELSAGGMLDALAVPKEEGDVADTTFLEGERWAPTVYRDADGNRKGTYVNVSTPIEVLPGRVTYVDLYVDVIKHADGTVEVVDEEELSTAVSNELLDEALARESRELATSIRRSLEPDGSVG